jgi:hypothetical protein
VKIIFPNRWKGSKSDDRGQMTEDRGRKWEFGMRKWDPSSSDRAGLCRGKHAEVEEVKAWSIGRGA